MLKFNVTKAYIDRNLGCSGETLVAEMFDIDMDVSVAENKQAISNYARYVCAGNAAEELFYERLAPGKRPENLDTHRNDLAELRRFASMICDDDDHVSDFIDWHLKDTRKWLGEADNFNAITNIAALLAKDYEIERAAIDAIIAEMAEESASASGPTTGGAEHQI